MSLTNDQKIIVQTTFAQISDADLLMSRFYDRLFEIDPNTRVLFKGDMAQQRKKLIQTLAVVVHGLDNLPALVPAIQELGKRHVSYGINVKHWESVGAALLWALADAFGDAFTEPVSQAWATAYGIIAQTAISAAYPELVE